MSELPMRGHFRYLRFKTFPMTPRTPQCEVFWALLLSSKHSGVPEDSKPPTFPSVGLHPHTWPKWGCDTYIDVLMLCSKLVVNINKTGCTIHMKCMTCVNITYIVPAMWKLLIWVLVSGKIQANPKSAILALKCLSNKILGALISRCIMRG